MKWNKFEILAANQPWIVGMVDTNEQLIDPATGRRDITKLGKLREFVRHKLGYVAFRPFNRLNLEEKRGWYESQTSFDHAIRCEPYLGGDFDTWYEVEWTVLTHNGAGITSDWSVRDDTSILDTIQAIKTRNDEGFLGEGDLSFDFVVRTSTEGTKLEGLTEMTVEVYRFPLGYRSPKIVEPPFLLNPLQKVLQAVGL
jgi:hypothetical protein